MALREPGKETGYAQLFIYRIPKKNRESMRQLLQSIASTIRKHGTLRSEFFQLHSVEAFQGFTGIDRIVSAKPDEELWVEVDHYKGRAHRDQAMAEIGKDASAGALFKQLRGLVSEGYSIVMGEFDGLAV